jgi:hypothetical protein
MPDAARTVRYCRTARIAMRCAPNERFIMIIPLRIRFIDIPHSDAVKETGAPKARRIL